MTFSASPEWNMQIETTPDWIGSTLRATMDCRAVTMWEATSTVSMHSCGRAAWPPLPVTSIAMWSLAASIGPERMANCPTGMPGPLCMP